MMARRNIEGGGGEVKRPRIGTILSQQPQDQQGLRQHLQQVLVVLLFLPVMMVDIER